MRGRLFHHEGDWYEWRQEPPLAATVHVRMASGDDGRLGVTELRISGALSSELLRSIPVGRIDAAANAQLVGIGDGEPRAAAARRRSVAPAGIGRVEAGWETADTAAPRRRRPGSRVPGRLLADTGRGRTDDFYAAIAGIYRELAQTSSRPAIELAEANQVPVTTAHRWIKEARRRGFLGPGRPGKAG